MPLQKRLHKKSVFSASQVDIIPSRICAFSLTTHKRVHKIVRKQDKLYIIRIRRKIKAVKRLNCESLTGHIRIHG